MAIMAGQTAQNLAWSSDRAFSIMPLITAVMHHQKATKEIQPPSQGQAGLNSIPKRTWPSPVYILPRSTKTIKRVFINSVLVNRIGKAPKKPTKTTRIIDIFPPF